METIETLLEDLGEIDYKLCWDYQEKLLSQIANQKLVNRNLPVNEAIYLPFHLLFCEHPHVYTLGKTGSMANLLLSEEELDLKEIDFYKINRGGDITYHGPGQLVMYPIFDLERVFTDIHRYLRYLEEAVIQTLAHFGIVAGRYEGYTGVWLEPENPDRARKICAMGVRCSRWVTMHGIALNVNTNLEYFNHIIPCGIDDKKVASMHIELAKPINMEDVKLVLQKKIKELFHLHYL